MPDNIAQQKGNFEVIVELIKVLIWPTIVFVLLTCNNTPTAKVINSISNKIDSASEVKATIQGNTIEIHKELKNSVNTISIVNAKNATTNLPTEVINTTNENMNVINAAKVLDTSINTNAENWVYLGKISNGKLLNTHFKINEIPKIGDWIEAKDAVYKRISKPVQLKDNEWRLGDIRGVVLDNEQVIIKDIINVEGNNRWALISNK